MSFTNRAACSLFAVSALLSSVGAFADCESEHPDTWFYFDPAIVCTGTVLDAEGKPVLGVADQPQILMLHIGARVCPNPDTNMVRIELPLADRNINSFETSSAVFFQGSTPAISTSDDGIETHSLVTTIGDPEAPLETVAWDISRRDVGFASVDLNLQFSKENPNEGKGTLNLFFTRYLFERQMGTEKEPVNVYKLHPFAVPNFALECSKLVKK